MKLRMLTLYVNEKRTLHPGDVADFSDEEAKALIDGRFAVRVEAVAETAVRRNPPERAMRRRPEPSYVRSEGQS